MSRNTSRASSSVSRQMMKQFIPQPNGPNGSSELALAAEAGIPLTTRLSASAMSLTLWVIARASSGVWPLRNIRFETLAAIRREAIEFPPWKISGRGLDSGFGRSGASWMR